MDVIKRLNGLRLERKLSVYRLAELSGLNQSTLANTFSRGTVPSIAHLEAMCNAMGVTLAQFFTEEKGEYVLSAQEGRLIENYRRLPEEVKKAVEDLAGVCAVHIS